MAAYSFLTTWCVDAPIERVWALISSSERYPEMTGPPPVAQSYNVVALHGVAKLVDF
jgi:hypothetical protein